MSEFKTVCCTLSEIDFSDRLFPFSFGSPAAKLVKSVAQVGVLQLPVVLESENGFKIVSGRQRLKILRQTGITTQDVKIFSMSGKKTLKDLFRQTLWENLALRDFNLVEAADIYLRALELFSEEELAREILPALQIPQRQRFFRRYQAIAGFSSELREMLATGIVDAESVDFICEWSDSEKKALIELVTETGLRRNKLREVIGRLDDLGRRDGVSPSVPLAAACKVILESGEKLEIEVLRRQLKIQLYPHLSKAQREFSEKIKKLSLPASIKLSPPPDFEGGEFCLSFIFNNSKEWTDACLKLNSISPEEIDDLCTRT